MCKLRRLTSLFLLSLFLLSCVNFGVTVQAASDNLIDSDLSNWGSLESYGTTSVYSNANIYRVSGKGTDNIMLGLIYDLPSLIAGHSYTLSFKLPSGSDIVSAWGVSWSDEQTINYYNNTTVCIGYGFLSADGTKMDTQLMLYEFNSSNISNYLGKTLKTSFVAGSASGRPAVFILISSSDSNIHHFYFSDFVMFDNDDNSQELTGIKGFLHSIRWDLVGGVCDDEDCPHSISVNPHLSLTERMTAGFSTMLDNLSSGVTNLGDREEGFFSNLGDRMSDFFDKLKESIFNSFADLGIDLEGWFDNVGTWFDDTVGSIDGFFADLWSKLSEFFDKFKPRVYMNFEWVRGIVNYTTGEVSLRDDKFPYVIISEAFTIEPGTKFLVDFVCNDKTKGLAIFQYDYYGNFIGVLKSSSSSFEGLELPSGFQYRFRTEYPPGVTDLDQVNDYVLVYCEEGWVNALLYNLKHGIKDLFVPDELFLTNFKAEVSKIFEDSLGFVYTFIDYVVQLFDKLQDIFSSVRRNDVFAFTFPKFEFDFLGYHIKLWDDITISMDWLNGTTGIGLLYSVYKGMLHFMFIIALVNYGDKVYKDVTSSD